MILIPLTPPNKMFDQYLEIHYTKFYRRIARRKTLLGIKFRHDFGLTDDELFSGV